jgi:hypothetical protein
MKECITYNVVRTSVLQRQSTIYANILQEFSSALIEATYLVLDESCEDPSPPLRKKKKQELKKSIVPQIAKTICL